MDACEIKDYCDEAQIIADSHGIYAALSYVLGQKFCAELFRLKELNRKLKFLQPAEMDSLAQKSSGIQSFQLSYALTAEDNFQTALEKSRFLKDRLDNFRKEIQLRFKQSDIEEYFNTYPRLEYKRTLTAPDDALNNEELMTGKAVLEEAEDIFIIEELKRIFK
ncbi:MAG: hypothetical protein G3M78_13030 [Candidatus Nitrohelix vancouverensis]|uniref:Uncharacterized protein n=1 Tax=Candidatus Nitrohelix vancouverensis TaxID=2705534 RepID=A0A7T0C488_9BACT|nr:MAG: hypothetical protein G3M78_13030 [Candidatus Nitrohelix vancouverensis]